MSATSKLRPCSKCGEPIPAEAPQGLCPRCLLLGLAQPTEAGKGTATQAPPPSDEELAAAFPQLQILGLIGQGGMGFVFKARQLKLDRLVALKILPQSLAADPAFAERFTREGRALARLSHPNIVAVHDFGQAQGFFYLLMEYVDGVNLRQAMKAGRFTPAQALAVVPKICEGLEYAHKEGVLHRDIKPENILLDAKGRVKIADFGIAKLTEDRPVEAALTDTKGALGTPHYMAPEQLERPSSVDHRADVYSLGVVFYEMLTGELPIGRFAPPSEKSTVDPRVDEVVLRALEKEPERRTQSAGDVRTQVEMITTSERLGEAEESSGKPRMRHKKPFQQGIVLGMASMLVLLAVVAWFRQARTGSESLSHSATNAEPVTTTIVLTRVTNQVNGGAAGVQTVSAWTDAEVKPGESLSALVKWPDGRMANSQSLEFVHWRANGVGYSCSFSWSFGGPTGEGFGEEDAEAATFQLSHNLAERPLTLTRDKPFQVFSVTNRFGGAMTGYLLYKRTASRPAESSRAGTTKPQAIVHIRSYGGFQPSLQYSVKLPPGFALRATSSIGEVHTHFAPGLNPGDYWSTWFQPPGYLRRHLPRLAMRNLGAQTETQASPLETQLQALQDRGPIPVVLGEPLQVFSITNQPGETFSGFLELVGPAQAPN